MDAGTRNRRRSEEDLSRQPTSKRARIDPDESSRSYLPCSNCKDLIPEDLGSYFTLGCCPVKRLCADCFGCLVSTVTSLHQFKCPSCDELTSAFKSHQPKQGRTRATGIEMSHDDHVLETPTPQNNLQGAFLSRGHDSKAPAVGIAVMAMKNAQDDEQAPELKTYSDILNAFDTQEWSEEQIQMFEKIFKIFHSLFVKEDTTEHPTFDPVSYPTNESVNQLAMDRSTLNRLICCLAYGQTIEEVVTEMESAAGDKSFYRVLKTVFAASDLIGSLANENRESLIKAMIGVHCAAQVAPDNLFAVLNDFNLAPSKNTMNRYFMKEANDKIIEGFDFGLTTVWCYCSLSYDNEGFKVRGGTKNRVGYLQTTHRRQFIHPAETLTAHNLYADPDNPNAPVLSREPACVWEEERKKDDFIGWEGIKKPNDSDYNHLSIPIYNQANNTMKLEADDKFPSYKEAEDMCRDFRFNYSDARLLRFHEFGMKKIIDGPEGKSELYTTLNVDWREEDQDESVDEDPTNDVLKFADVPMEADLNKEPTVKALLDYTLMMRKKLLDLSTRSMNQAWVEAQKQAKIIPLLESYTVALCGDGAPSYMMTRLKRTIQEYKDTIVGFGGFHLGLTAWRGTGALYGGAVSGPLHSLVRSTEAMLRWVLNPGDPNQVEEATAIIITVLYIEALRGLIRTKVENGEISETDEEVEISVQDVLDHIVERARKHPIVLVLLAYMRAMHALQLLSISEKQASVELYLTCMKFIGLIAAISHHTSYVSMIADFFAMWHCAAPALKKLYEIAVLFRQTKNGKWIFSDHEMEDFIGDTRLFLGRHCNGTVETHLDSVRKLCMNMDKFKTIRNLKIEDLNRPSNKALVRINRIFCEILLYCRDSNMFGPGNVAVVPPKKFVDREGPYEEVQPYRFLALDGEPMNPSSCFGYSISLKTDEEYFNCYLVDGDPSDPTRSEGREGAPLALINPLADPKDVLYEKEKLRVNEMDPQKLIEPGLYTMEELRVEYNALKTEVEALKSSRDAAKKRRYYRMNQYNDRQDKKANKTTLIGAIVKARELLSELDSEWKKKREDALENRRLDDSIVEMENIEQKLRDEANQKYFTLAGTTGMKEFEGVKHNIKVAKALTAETGTGEAMGDSGDGGSEGHGSSQPASQGFGAGFAGAIESPALPR